MEWNHSGTMSLADDGAALVVESEEGWEAMPFGVDGGSSGTFATREQAIEIVESLIGEVICCVGHLAEDSDL